MKSNGTCYFVTAPYPAVPALPANPGVVRRLLSAYAGRNSELSAVTQYFYNSLLAGLAGKPEISEMFACVSHVEMHHLELLGQLILAYGGDPGFLSYGPNGRTQWWTGAYLTYQKQPAEMLRQAIGNEEASIEAYRNICTRLPEAGARALLERIIADEERHIALFTEALAGLPMPLQA